MQSGARLLGRLRTTGAANGAERSSSYRGSRGLSPWVAPLRRQGEKPGCVETNTSEEMECRGQINKYIK